MAECDDELLSSELLFEGEFDGLVADPGVCDGVSDPKGEPVSEPRHEANCVGFQFSRAASLDDHCGWHVRRCYAGERFYPAGQLQMVLQPRIAAWFRSSWSDSRCMSVRRIPAARGPANELVSADLAL